MTVMAVGVTHRTAPLEALECAAAAARSPSEVLAALTAKNSVQQAMLLSTCNRVEVYAVGNDVDEAAAEISEVLACRAGHVLEGHLQVYDGPSSVEHLFAVAAGLDSLVVGDAQIIGQLRTAYAQACALGTVGTELHQLTQQALRVGKRVRTETRISAAAPALVCDALAAAAAALGTLRGRRALLVGSGILASLTAQQLIDAGVSEVVVANRTTANARRLAERLRAAGSAARAVGLDSVQAEVAAADIVVACASGTERVLDSAAVGARDKALVVCDLAMPRAVDSEVGALAGVTLIDLAAMSGRPDGRELGPEVAVAHALVAEEARGYVARRLSTPVVPAAVALPIGPYLEREVAAIRRPDGDASQGRRARGRVRLTGTSEVRATPTAHGPHGDRLTETSGPRHRGR